MIKFIIYLVYLFYNVREDSDLCKPTPTNASGLLAPQRICSGNLIFQDNFDSLDTRKWLIDQTLAGGGNGEFEWYSDDPKNCYVQNGTLHIRPTLLADERGEDFLYNGTIDISEDKCTLEQWNGCKRTGNNITILNPIKSARISTSASFSFKFGKVEVRAKVPAGDWLWPAIWLLPQEWKYGGWPESGEIDIMESRGNRNLGNIGVQQVASTLHWGPDPQNNMNRRTHWTKHLKQGFNADFHKYQMEWTLDYIKFSVDDQEIGRVTPSCGGFWEYGDLQTTGMKNPWTNSKMAPFDQNFFLLINLAVGGTNGYFPDGIGNKPWSNHADNAITAFWQGRDQWLPTWNVNTDDSHFQVDYVRVWAL